MRIDMSTNLQTERVAKGNGFIAALDQSGGSTPKALKLYGVPETAYSGEAAMFDMIHAMRARIIKSPAFTGDKVVGAILFEQTMDRMVDGIPTANYLWDERRVVPFLKIDKGLEAEVNACQLMKPMPDLAALLARAVKAGIYGTKERSVISGANVAGIQAVLDQQFAVGAQVSAHGLMPILEPEVTISIADKAEAEAILRDALLRGLDALPSGQQVMLKLTLPNEANFYAPLVDHPNVLKVVALSGGYSRADANAILARNRGIIASFSRALTEGLSAQQSDAEFNAALGAAITSIHAASVAG
jgi:fructose-bisphosphate aldolase class I